MLNISKFVKMAESLRGTKGSFTLGKEALRAASGKAGKKGEAIFNFATKGLKDPAVDLAYKGSKQGFTIATATVRDGKQVVGRGAVSISGAGTEQSVIKYRIQAGENGKILQQNGWIDNTKQLTLDDISTTIRRKGGVTTKTVNIGEAAASRTQFNETELAKAADQMSGIPIATNMLEQGKTQVQGILDKVQQGFRDLLAGKEVNIPTEKLKNKFASLKGKVKPMAAPQNLKSTRVKVSEEVKKILNEKPVYADGAKKFIRVPSGKDVPVEEYAKTIQTLLKGAENTSAKQAERLLKEAKMLSEYAKQQGVPLENSSILENIFKLFKI